MSMAGVGQIRNERTGEVVGCSVREGGVLYVFLDQPQIGEEVAE